MKIKNYVLSLLIGVALIALGMQSNVQGKSIGSALKAVHPSVAQGRGRGQAQPRGDAMGGGHIPAHGPPPFRSQQHNARSAPRGTAPADRNFADRPGHPNATENRAMLVWVG